ncbi:MAG: oligogalacturonide lyase [Mediterranea massiliensis]|nr:oligogalacturonide lyase [Mediterranea massiliensis]
MKRFLLSVTVCLGLSLNASAQFGNCTPSERWSYVDEKTGQTVVVLTDTLKNDRFLYQTDPMWTADGKYLLFRSSSRGDDKMIEQTAPNGQKRSYRPTQIYFIEMETGKIIQATEGPNLGNAFLANRTNKMFMSRREKGDWNMYVMDLDKFFADVKKGKVGKSKDYETFIATFPTEMGRPGGYAIDCNDDFAYIGVERDGTDEEKEAMMKKAFLPETNQPIKIKPVLSGLRKMNLKTGEVTKIIDTDFKIGHIQASRFTPGEIVFCNETGGDANQRMWFCTADGSVFKPLYKETPLDWVTHETFGTKDYVYFNILGFQPRLRKQANGILRINIRTDDVELLGQVEMDMDRQSQLTGRGFWHCNSSRDNKWAAGDTFAGSVWLINVETGQRHWMVSDTKMKPDHAHPSFSPDGTKLLFQSGHFTNGKRLNLMMIDISSMK